MAEFDNMRKSLPVAYRTDKWVCDLLAAIQSLDDTQREQMLDITQQLFPGSMTWALAIEERDAGLASTVGFAKGVILLTFIGAYGIPAPAELAALQEAVDRVIPCHLASKYLWRWILVREIEGMTLDELQTHKISEFAFEEVQA